MGKQLNKTGHCYKGTKSYIKGAVRFGSTESAFLKRENSHSYQNHETPFRATLTMFKNYVANTISYTLPLSYDQWLSIADEHKAAVLYVQFYDQISLAWVKLRTDAAIEETCVEEALQYLMKNVPLIAENASKFSPGYIYRIVYNAIYCKSIDPWKGQTAATSWYNNTTSRYIKSGDGEELDIFAITPDDSIDEMDEILTKERFWALIEDMGVDTVSLVNKLLGGNFMDGHRVLGKKQQELIAKLREVLAPYRELYHI